MMRNDKSFYLLLDMIFITLKKDNNDYAVSLIIYVGMKYCSPCELIAKYINGTEYSRNRFTYTVN